MLLWMLLLAACSAPAQNALWIDLSGEWRIQYEDRPEFANSDFDDRGWPTHSLPFLENPMVFNNKQFWLRRAVELPAGADRRQLALTLGAIPTVYEVYINGQRIGASGDFHSFAEAQIHRPRTFPIPADAVAGNQALHIAIRCGSILFMHPAWRLPDRGPYLLTDAAHAPKEVGREALDKQRGEKWPIVVLATAYFFITLLSLLAWWSEPGRKELLWFALVSLSRVLASYVLLAGLLVTTYPFNSIGVPRMELICNHVGLPLLGEVALAALGLRSPWLRVVLWLGWGVLPLSTGIESLYRTGASFGNVWTSGFILVVVLWEWWRMRRRGMPLFEHAFRLALLAPALGGFHYWLDEMFEFTGFLNRRVFYSDLYGFDGSFLPVSFVILALLIRRLMDDRRERQRMTQELEAARQVQALLLSGAQATAKNLTIDSQYLPAQEVGGDFWQVASTGDALLVLAGDVSGKGLKAAMVVSMVVGAFANRRSSRPGELLGEMNRALCGRMDGGFVTCCCAVIEPGGAVTIANAGNPPPYLAGEEVATAAGLPLGLTGEAAYEEITCAIAAGGQLTILSDGVVEAANANGELFGFERTQAISGVVAREIVEAARAWGQNDDITVVTVRRIA